jgi:hypothetical protein
MKDIPAGWGGVIYHKGIDIANFGREPSTFIHHIITHYDDLADVTAFVQGNPFDHWPTLLENLAAWAKDDYDMDCRKFAWLGKTHYTSMGDGSPHDNKPVAAVAENLGLRVKRWPITFGAGGQFAVTKEAIRARPKTFYENAMLILKLVPESPWCFERLWEEIFNGQE